MTTTISDNNGDTVNDTCDTELTNDDTNEVQTQDRFIETETGNLWLAIISYTLSSEHTWQFIMVQFNMEYVILLLMMIIESDFW